MKKLKDTKIFEFVKSNLSTKDKTGKQKVKPVTIRVILIGAIATVLNALADKYLGVSVPVDSIIDFLTSL